MATLKFHSTRSRKTRRRFHADNTALIIVVGARDKNYTPLSHLVGRHRQVFEFTLPNPRGEYTRVEPRRVWAPGYAYAYIRTQWHNKYDVHVERLGLTVWDPERGERADENIIAKSFIRHRAARVYVNYVRTGRMRGWSRESSHRYRIYIYIHIYIRAHRESANYVCTRAFRGIIEFQERNRATRVPTRFFLSSPPIERKRQGMARGE